VLLFAGGFVIGVLTGALVFLSGKRFKTQSDKSQHLTQLEELSKLTGGLAHEIKNPLSTVKLTLDLVSEELQESSVAQSGQRRPGENNRALARAQRQIGVIQKETARLEQILEDFLHYIDRTEPRLANTDVNELVSDMVDFYSPQAHSHSLTIRLGLHDGPLICRIDANMLKQVMLNLFINAQQAMANGGELMIRTDRQKNDAVVQISDTGHGVPADQLPHIFDAYYSSHRRGSGLGLPTARKIMDAHKGMITVDSEPGKGTSFTLKLPLQAQ
jgi:signal transduction histidine kinase